MSDGTCSACADSTESFACPVCLTQGSPVKELTVKALLSDAALRRFEPGAHRFCSSASCDVVYFDAAGRTFTTADVRAPVWQKQPPGARLLCYCFGENEGDIGAEVERTGDSKAPERVRAHIEAGRCACEVRNPRGRCCLGDVTQAVRRVSRG